MELDRAFDGLVTCDRSDACDPVVQLRVQVAAPLSYAGPFAALWMLIGAGYLIYLYKRHPGRIADTAKMFIPDEEPATREQSYADRKDGGS
jgi:hypothetical protein